MAGQPPYKPFENDRLKWERPNSEVGAPALAARAKQDFDLRKPGILLFLASADAGNCCASNYERFIFRDQKVVRLSDQEFNTVRINRAGVKKDVLKRYKIEAKRPALLITDCEGAIFARFDRCTSAADVVKAMVGCLKTSRKKAKVTLQAQGKLDDAEALVRQESFRPAGMLLRKILRGHKGGIAAIHIRAQAMLDQVTARGEELHREALALSDVTARYDELLRLRHDFWLFDELVGRIKPEIRDLEEGEATKATIFNHQGMKLVRQAQALIEQGKGSKGRTLLRKVRREFEGAEAAEKAQSLLK